MCWGTHEHEQQRSLVSYTSCVNREQILKSAIICTQGRCRLKVGKVLCATVRAAKSHHACTRHAATTLDSSG